jgi:hypothetical protein
MMALQKKSYKPKKPKEQHIIEQKDTAKTHKDVVLQLDVQ